MSNEQQIRILNDKEDKWMTIDARTHCRRCGKLASGSNIFPAEDGYVWRICDNCCAGCWFQSETPLPKKEWPLRPYSFTEQMSDWKSIPKLLAPVCPTCQGETPRVVAVKGHI